MANGQNGMRCKYTTLNEIEHARAHLLAYSFDITKWMWATDRPYMIKNSRIDRANMRGKLKVMKSATDIIIQYEMHSGIVQLHSSGWWRWWWLERGLRQLLFLILTECLSASTWFTIYKYRRIKRENEEEENKNWIDDADKWCSTHRFSMQPTLLNSHFSVVQNKFSVSFVYRNIIHINIPFTRNNINQQSITHQVFWMSGFSMPMCKTLEESNIIALLFFLNLYFINFFLHFMFFVLRDFYFLSGQWDHFGYKC